jgi:hypothetical protein
VLQAHSSIDRLSDGHDPESNSVPAAYALADQSDGTQVSQADTVIMITMNKPATSSSRPYS